jgi:hypothetical protein
LRIGFFLVMNELLLDIRDDGSETSCETGYDDASFRGP